MVKNETYEINVICRNCGHVPGKYNHRDEIIPRRFPVAKGIEVKIFLRDMTCENCECDGYMGLLNQPG